MIRSVTMCGVGVIFLVSTPRLYLKKNKCLQHKKLFIAVPNEIIINIIRSQDNNTRDPKQKRTSFYLHVGTHNIREIYE